MSVRILYFSISAPVPQTYCFSIGKDYKFRVVNYLAADTDLQRTSEMHYLSLFINHPLTVGT